MIQVNDKNIENLELFDHVQHYGNAHGVVCKVGVLPPRSRQDQFRNGDYYVFVSEADHDGYNLEYRGLGEAEVKRILFWSL